MSTFGQMATGLKRILALRLGEPDAHPSSTLTFQPLPSPTTPHRAATLGQHSERWRPWRALAATHLWLADNENERRLRGAA